MPSERDSHFAQQIIAQTQSIVGQRRWIAQLIAAACGFLSGVVLVVLLDALFDLPILVRLPTVPLFGGAGVLGAIILLVVRQRFYPSEQSAITLTEQAIGDKRRLMATAVALEKMSSELALAGAKRIMAELPSAQIAAQLPAGMWKKWLLGIGFLVAGCFLIHTVQPRLFPTVIPRLTDPSGDHPPFSRSVLRWELAPERVRFGGTIRVEGSIENAGQQTTLTLHAQARGDNSDSGKSREILTIPMFQIAQHRFAAEMTNITEPMTMWIAGEGTRTHYRTLVVDMIPRITRVDAHIIAPRYARLDTEPHRIDPNQVSELAVLPGSTLQLMAQGNRALTALWAGRDNATPTRYPIVNGQSVIEKIEPGTWLFAWEADDGMRSDVLAPVRITPRDDQPPRARIAQPQRDAVATPDMIIPLTVESDDDLGLSRVMRTVALNQLAAPHVEQHVAERRHQYKKDLALGQLGVQVGDVIHLQVVAQDTRPQAQYSKSDSRSIQIISEEKYNELLLRRVRPDTLERKYAPYAKRLKEIEEALAELRKNANNNPELKKQLAELAEKTRELQRDVAHLKRKSPLFAVEPALQKILNDAAEKLAQQAESGQLGSDSQQGKKLAEELALMTRLARAYGFMMRLRQLIDAEQNATDRLLPFADHRQLSDSERVRLAELGAQEETIAQGLEAWIDVAPKMADDLRYGPWAKADNPDATRSASESADLLEQLASAVSATGAISLKQQAARHARASDGAEAHRLAADARDRLLALLPKCSGGMCLAEARMRLCWGNGNDLAKTLSCLGMGMGFGLGGVGAGGLGLFVGYGGDDMGMSAYGDNMDLYGPENLGDELGLSGDSVDGVSAIAASGSGDMRDATRYEQKRRGSKATKRSALSPEQQKLIDEYYKRLESGEKK
jgi:hypothetical protein